MLHRLKKPITIRLDEDSVSYFKTISEEVGIPYQSLINPYLCDCAAAHKKLTLSWRLSRIKFRHPRPWFDSARGQQESPLVGLFSLQAWQG